MFFFMDAVAFKFLSVGLMGIALAGTAIGVGKIFAAALDGIARNPSAEEKIAKYVYVGAGMAEAMGLFALVLAFLLMFT